MLPNGTLIDDRYEILQTLGRGGFGAVYKAKQVQFDRLVAIKVLESEYLAEQGDGLARFEREAKAINVLRHKNIVSLYAFGIYQRAPYMVIELVDGKPLDKLIAAEGAMPPRRAVNIMKQVFEGLASAHGAGVVHRDLKPANIMIVDAGSEHEQVKIIDFGLVKLMPGYGVPGQKLTETGYALGTAFYMAPEQALGGQVDARADIYAAGCIFYELLTGRRPFDAEDNVAVMYQHLNDEPVSLSNYLPSEDPSSAAIATIVSNCLVKDPGHRYQTCEEVLTDLNASTVTRRGAPGAPPPLRVASKPSKVLLIASSVLLTIATVCYFFVNPPNGPAPTSDPSETSMSLYRKFDGQSTVKFALTEAPGVKLILQKQHQDNLLADPERFALYVRLAAIYAFHTDMKPDSAMQELALQKESKKYLAEASRLWPTVESRVKEDWALYTSLRYAELLTLFGRDEDALRVYETLLTRATMPNSLVDADARIRLALRLCAVGRYAEAERWIDPLFKKILEPEKLCEVFTMQSFIALHQGKYEEALSTALKGICTADQTVASKFGAEPTFRYRSFAAQTLAMAAAAKLNNRDQVQELAEEVVAHPHRFQNDATMPIVRGTAQWEYAYSVLRSAGYSKIVSQLQAAAKEDNYFNDR